MSHAQCQVPMCFQCSTNYIRNLALQIAQHCNTNRKLNRMSRREYLYETIIKFIAWNGIQIRYELVLLLLPLDKKYSVSVVGRSLLYHTTPTRDTFNTSYYTEYQIANR